MKPHIVMIECVDYILWQLFLWRLYIYYNLAIRELELSQEAIVAKIEIENTNSFKLPQFIEKNMHIPISF